MLNGRAWGNSIWTDFKDRWNGNTYLGSYSTGSFMSDWTFLGTAVTNQVSAISGSISGQAYAHAAAQSSGVQHYADWGAIPNTTNCDILVGGRVLSSAPAPTDGFGPFLRRNANGRMHAILSGSNTFPRSQVTLVSINLTNIYNTSFSFSWSTNTWYWLRVNASGGTLRAKLWARGAAEPSSWDATWAPFIPQNSSGDIGLILGAGANSSQQIDFFSFCSDGNPAWGPL
ncbi:hypothetical protein J2S75_002831 [Ancylobacter polymorphus]|uniref:Uncharacterized protein n=1 Tax=Ancylobacter polymorphus TaxID=223390 RepID=A0ABU0BD76_9HYPH|nr:hypothetical protein [Ancylobacter polymorphus]